MSRYALTLHTPTIHLFPQGEGPVELHHLQEHLPTDPAPHWLRGLWGIHHYPGEDTQIHPYVHPGKVSVTLNSVTSIIELKSKWVWAGWDCHACLPTHSILLVPWQMQGQWQLLCQVLPQVLHLLPVVPGEITQVSQPECIHSVWWVVDLENSGQRRLIFGCETKCREQYVTALFQLWKGRVSVQQQRE